MGDRWEKWEEIGRNNETMREKIGRKIKKIGEMVKNNWIMGLDFVGRFKLMRWIPPPPVLYGAGKMGAITFSGKISLNFIIWKIENGHFFNLSPVSPAAPAEIKSKIWKK